MQAEQLHAEAEAKAPQAVAVVKSKSTGAVVAALPAKASMQYTAPAAM